MQTGQILIQINWLYFLGIVGVLITGAWYAGGRFAKIESSINWLTDKVQNLIIDVGSMRAEISSIKVELGVVKNEIRHVEGEVSGIKLKMKDLKIT